MHIKHSALIALPLAAASLLGGCASHPVNKDVDSLVPVGTERTEEASSREDQFMRKLTPTQRDSYKNLAFTMGAVLGAERNPNSALTVLLKQMLGR